MQVLPNISANAGVDQIVCNEITLDGTNSYDPDNNIVSYQWQIRHRENSAFDIDVEGNIVTVRDLKNGFYDVTLILLWRA